MCNTVPGIKKSIICNIIYKLCQPLTEKNNYLVRIVMRLNAVHSGPKILCFCDTKCAVGNSECAVGIHPPTCTKYGQSILRKIF